MPTVPQFNEPRVQPARTPGIQLGQTQADIGGIAAQGLEGIGQILEQERLKADRTAVTAAETSRESWANTALYDPESGAFTREGKNALGVTNDVLGAYDEQTKQISKGLRGARQNEAFLQSSQQSRVALQGQLARYEFSERGKYEDQTANARIATAIDTSALNYNDPLSLKQSREAITGTLKVQQTAKGWSDEELAGATAAKVNQLHGSVIERMLADGKVGAAKGYLTANKGELQADDQLKFARAIDTLEREKKNELTAQVRERIADLSASYKSGLPVPSGQELSPGIIEAAFPGKGAEIYSSLQADKRMGYALKDINQQSPAEVNDVLKGYQVTQGGAGAKDALERQVDLERAARASLEARQKNPAQFAIDNRLGYQPLPSDPEGVTRELQNREAIQAQTSQKVGVPVPMLTPDEAKKIGQNLATTDSKTAVQTFDYLRNSVGDQAYTNIMQQIAPDSPVKAYAGQIYGKQTDVTLKTHLFSANETAPARIVAETLVTGENLINKTKQAKTEDGKPQGNLYLPNRQQFDAAFVGKVGDAFAGRPDAQNLALQVAYAYYVGKSAQTGRLNSDNLDVDSGLLQESLRAAVGTVVSFHGYGDVLAPLGMDESTFTDKATGAFNAELKARGIEPQNFDALGLRNWKGDQYLVTKGRDLFSLKGEPIVITVK